MCVYCHCCYRSLRLFLSPETATTFNGILQRSFRALNRNTTSHLPQPVNNPFQQPPPEYTASVTPPQYTLTSSNGSGGMNATPKASVTSPDHQ
ncbi:unnamed protein product [Porites lobata]|uniref:Uncharacterized protein n=1 Tax=Porites lobata TaxID=104759 RepID=A0ABN8PZJ6_9CNID|nr:unnamed protein product [Porites lobata]